MIYVKNKMSAGVICNPCAICDLQEFTFKLIADQYLKSNK